MHHLDASLLSTNPSSVLATLLESLPLFVFWKDRDSRYCGCNLSFAKLLGFSSPDALVGKTDFELGWQVQGDHAWLFREGDQAAMAGQPVVNQEENLALPNREPLIVCVNKRALYDSSGQVVGVLATAMDITALKKTEYALKAAEAQADCARQAKSAFIANISHDIRTPFVGVVSLTQQVEQKAPPEIKEYLQLIRQSGEQLLTWFNQIIQMLQVEAQIGYALVEPFLVQETLEGIIKILLPVAEQKSLNLSLEYKRFLPDRLVGDVLRLKHLLLNLVSNAITFTAQGFVKIQVDGQGINDRQFQLEIAVIDSGVGIAQEDQAAIFDRFSRLDPAYMTQRPAPGLGLAMAKQLIQDLQGTMTLESVLGQGSRFCITLPLAYSEAQEASHENQ